MDTYGDAGGYGDASELYGGGGGNGGGNGGNGDDENRMGGEAAIRKPPRPAR